MSALRITAACHQVPDIGGDKHEGRKSDRLNDEGGCDREPETAASAGAARAAQPRVVAVRRIWIDAAQKWAFDRRF
jgi:hypothetical protein